MERMRKLRSMIGQQVPSSSAKISSLLFEPTAVFREPKVFDCLRFVLVRYLKLALSNEDRPK